MNVEYICHACLLIDTGDARIVTDPWFDGPAYSGQWHVFPRPLHTDKLQDVDTILISHGHEDHFHPRTLRGLPKSARVFYPYSWFGGTKAYIESLGFATVNEAISFRKYALTKDTSVTYIAQGHDNIIVVESGGNVLVNVNDALHSESDQTIDFFLAILRKEWPQIDMLFCGFGGASYFPNMLHVEGKDDYAIGVVREQLFAHNFCRIVAGLRPHVAVPFAADFVLLGPGERWINEVRFPRHQLRSYFQRSFGGYYEQQIHEMYPGDTLEGGQLKPTSSYRRDLQNGELTHLIDSQYAQEIERKKTLKLLAEDEAERLREEIADFISIRARLFSATELRELSFCLAISDASFDNCFDISFPDVQPRIMRTSKPSVNNVLTMETSSRLLRYSMKHDWGGDALGIGYGVETQLRDRQVAAANLDQVCMGLLTKQPGRKSQIKNDPWRVFNYWIRQPPLRTFKSWRKFSSRLGNINYDRSIWLLKPTEELRKILDLPAIGVATAPRRLTSEGSA